MIIFLDYDETYTLDPEFWNNFILNAKKSGHTVFGLTMRYNNESESIENSLGKFCKVIYTERNSKVKFAYNWLSENNIHPFPVVFIDDNPYFLLNNSK